MLEEIDELKKENSVTKKPYNPMACPPDLERCLYHQQATRVGVPKDLDSDKIIDLCECCGAPYDNELLKLCSHRDELSFLGLAYPLYYDFVIFCGLYFIVLFGFSGIYGMQKNVDGLFCIAENNLVKDSKELCPLNIFTKYSIVNKGLSVEHEKDWQAKLNLIATAGLIVLVFAFRIYNKLKEIKLDSEWLAPSDFTLMVEGLPKDTQENIEAFFESCLDGVKTPVADVSQAYFISDYLKLKEDWVRCLNIEKTLLERDQT